MGLLEEQDSSPADRRKGLMLRFSLAGMGNRPKSTTNLELLEAPDSPVQPRRMGSSRGLSLSGHGAKSNNCIDLLEDHANFNSTRDEPDPKPPSSRCMLRGMSARQQQEDEHDPKPSSFRMFRRKSAPHQREEEHKSKPQSGRFRRHVSPQFCFSSSGSSPLSDAPNSVISHHVHCRS
jgi:hypothetical protein